MKRRSICIAFFAAAILTAFGTNVFAGTAEGYSGGSGVSNDPYLISNAGQLSEMRDNVNAGKDNDVYYKLIADIDLSGIPSWTPIGSESDYNFFSGTFDGAGHTVSGLNVSGSEYAGLFGYICDATVKDLTVSGVVSGNEDVGGSISECYSYASDDRYHALPHGRRGQSGQ